MDGVTERRGDPKDHNLGEKSGYCQTERVCRVYPNVPTSNHRMIRVPVWGLIPTLSGLAFATVAGGSHASRGAEECNRCRLRDRLTG